MTFAWREHAEAFEEYRAAAKWYETQRPGWGDVFMDSVDSSIETIRDPSIRWGFYLGRRSTPQVYSRSVAGFPFDIVFLLIGEEVYVVAYAHERRMPGYWAHRVEG